MLETSLLLATCLQIFPPSLRLASCFHNSAFEEPKVLISIKSHWPIFFFLCFVLFVLYLRNLFKSKVAMISV